MARFKATCHVCGAEDVNVSSAGRLVRHFERIVTTGGKVTTGVFRCAGSGEPVEES